MYNIEDTTIQLARYILDTKSTIRATAQKFNMAKSTVHYYLKFKLKQMDIQLYWQVKNLLQANFTEKHIRGGLATRQKYLNEKIVQSHEEYL